MASVYQKIHAFALKAQARHRHQLEGLYRTAADLAEIYRTDCCTQQFRTQECDKLDMQECPIVSDDLQYTRRSNHPCTSELNDSMSPIENTISSLRYSSIPYFSFENHNKPNQHSRKRVIRSGDGWFEDLEDVRTDPTIPSKKITGHPTGQLIYVPSGGHTHFSQVPETDSDTDSSSPAPSTEPDSEVNHWLHVIEEVVGGGDWEERLDHKLPRSHEVKTQCSITETDPTVPQKIPLKGMARLRRISPSSIKTATLQETKQDPGRANVIIQGDIRETRKLKPAKDSLPLVNSNVVKSPIDQGYLRTNPLIVMTPKRQVLLDLLVHGTK